MNREYVENMKAEAEKSFQKALGELVEFYRNLPIPADMREFILKDIDQKVSEGENAEFINGISHGTLAVRDFVDMKYSGKTSPEDKAAKMQEKEAAWDIVENKKFFELGQNIVRADAYRRHDFERYQDSEPMGFDGDIIITDPCYIIRHYEGRPVVSDYVKEDSGVPDDVARTNLEKYRQDVKAWDETHDDWERVDYGTNMEAIGINHYITRDTIYGDWMCTTFDLDQEGNYLGNFCADSGQVSVFLLDEVLKYNPDFDLHNEQDSTFTLIRNFKGEVHVEVERVEWEADEDTNWCHKGQIFIDYEVHVVGHGVDKVTGKPINFRTCQTGL